MKMSNQTGTSSDIITEKQPKFKYEFTLAVLTTHSDVMSRFLGKMKPMKFSYTILATKLYTSHTGIIESLK
jgi:hypothetical protein